MKITESIFNKAKHAQETVEKALNSQSKDSLSYVYKAVGELDLLSAEIIKEAEKEDKDASLS